MTELDKLLIHDSSGSWDLIEVSSTSRCITATTFVIFHRTSPKVSTTCFVDVCDLHNLERKLLPIRAKRVVSTFDRKVFLRSWSKQPKLMKDDIILKNFFLRWLVWHLKEYRNKCQIFIYGIQKAKDKIVRFFNQTLLNLINFGDKI